jgi:hypothetical protein
MRPRSLAEVLGLARDDLVEGALLLGARGVHVATAAKA